MAQRLRTLLTATAIVATLAGSAIAQTDEQRRQCADEKAAPDQRINGCTAVIDAASTSQEDRVAALNNRAKAYEAGGEQDRALADYTEALKLDPKDLLALNNRGFIYFKAGRYDEAISDYTKAIEADLKLRDPVRQPRHGLPAKRRLRPRNRRFHRGATPRAKTCGGTQQSCRRLQQ